MTQSFENWTAYDEWLIENYSYYNITSLNEVDGKIVAVYDDKPGAEKPAEKK